LEPIDTPKKQFEEAKEKIRVSYRSAKDYNSLYEKFSKPDSDKTKLESILSFVDVYAKNDDLIRGSKQDLIANCLAGAKTYKGSSVNILVSELYFVIVIKSEDLDEK
jgi:hypothetical protein